MDLTTRNALLFADRSSFFIAPVTSCVVRANSCLRLCSPAYSNVSAALIVLNMGAEMIYILEQRLRAQSIAVDKAKKVLTDVVRTMFSEVFLRELFKPQEVYTNRATRAVFDRLAHSSIMRLNKTSMDKLYDLMTMGFKLQTLHAVEPAQLLTVTLNHLDSLKALLSGVGPVRDLLDMAAAMSRARYEAMRPGELWRLKHALCRFFQDRRIKVSLFLQDGLQSMDGTLVLTFAGPLPVGTEIPGTLRYYHGHSGSAAAGAAGAGGAGAGGRAGAAGPGAASKTEHIAALALPGAFTATAREVRAACRLGENIYAKDRSGAAASASNNAANAAAGSGAAAASPSGGAAKPARPRGYSSDSDASPAASALSPAAAAGGAALLSPSGGAGAASASGHSRASLDLLASLVGPGGAPGSAAAGGAAGAASASEFKFALFGDDGELAGSGGTDGSGGDANVIVFDAADASRLRGMMARLGIDDEADAHKKATAGGSGSSSAAPATGAGSAGVGAPPTALGTGDDLLDLMDAL